MSLARGTVEGAAELMRRESAISPATLRRNVTSPGGTTAAALAVLRQPRGLEDLMARAAGAAHARAARWRAKGAPSRQAAERLHCQEMSNEDAPWRPHQRAKPNRRRPTPAAKSSTRLMELAAERRFEDISVRDICQGRRRLPR